MKLLPAFSLLYHIQPGSCLLSLPCRAPAGLLLCHTCSPAEIPGQWGENVQTTICSGKTNPVKDCVDFTAWGNGVQLLRVSVTDAFPPYLANVHIRLCPPVSLNNPNLDFPSLISLRERKNFLLVLSLYLQARAQTVLHQQFDITML